VLIYLQFLHLVFNKCTASVICIILSTNSARDSSICSRDGLCVRDIGAVTKIFDSNVFVFVLDSEDISEVIIVLTSL